MVYVYSAICETYLVYWYSIDLWSIGGGGIGKCAFCYISNSFGVVIFHTSLVDWSGYIYPTYMCILLYVKHFWCTGNL